MVRTPFSLFTGRRSATATTHSNRKNNIRRRLMIQSLEDRTVPTAYTVNATTDTGDMYMTFTDANVNLTDIVINKGTGSSNTTRALDFKASAPGTFAPTITLTNCTITGTTTTFAPATAGYYTNSAPLFSQGSDVT